VSLENRGKVLSRVSRLIMKSFVSRNVLERECVF
jgi:hypothetical protein